MRAKGHQKHTKLPRPFGGSWGRTEIALMGAPCGLIVQLAEKIIARYAGSLSIGWADALHREEATGQDHAAVHFLKDGARTGLRIRREPGMFQRRFLMNDCDLVLVNGNHFTAEAQIPVLHPAKSLASKLHLMTDVRLVILSAGMSIPEYLKDHIAGVPVAASSDEPALWAFFDALIEQRIPLLNGLVLAGGRSVRMGLDKGSLEYFGRPQRDHVYHLLRPFCADVAISCNAEQAPSVSLPKITDAFLGIGPLGGLLSAMQTAPDRAWLTVACDMPFADAAAISRLVRSRKPSRLATAFLNPDAGFPEPLLTIWEPRAYPVLLQALASGMTCPRKILSDSDIELVELTDTDTIRNINAPDDYDAAVAELNAACTNKKT